SSATLLDTLESFPGVSHIIHSYLECDLRACRLVSKRLRTVIDVNTTRVTICLDQASHHGPPYGPGSAEVVSELSSALSIPSRKHSAALQAVRELDLGSLQVPLHLSMVVNSSLAACTQLTKLECPNRFPGLSQLTQLRHVNIHKISLSAVTDLASLPHLTHLKSEVWVSTDQLGSSQRFMFSSLERLKLWEVDASFLAAMDCPQLQHLEFGEDYDTGSFTEAGLDVDSATGLRACADGILQHCSYVNLIRNPDVTLTAVLEALAPWQPSAAALSSTCWGMVLRLNDEKRIGASHLKLLPSSLQSLSLM
ncbi:hypothetical protein V8C86DRAFT_2672605, partial [Haematococcus lacustris]